jgi:hypothetical protein
MLTLSHRENLGAAILKTLNIIRESVSIRLTRLIVAPSRSRRCSNPKRGYCVLGQGINK